MELEKSYQQALNLLKSEVASKDTSSMHKEIHKASEILNKHKTNQEIPQIITSFQANEKARYKNESVLIVQILDKGYYWVETELGMRLKAHGSLLKKIQKPPKTNSNPLKQPFLNPKKRACVLI